MSQNGGVESLASASGPSNGTSANGQRAPDDADEKAGATNGDVSALSNGAGGDSALTIPCSHHLADEHRELVERLRRALKQEFADRDVDRYLDDEDMIRRYLKGHSWNFDTAKGYLSRSLAWRAKSPRPASWDCSYCIANPGYHCMRQVGFDVVGRPVFYSSFVQPSVTRNTGDDSVEHFVYLTENAIRAIHQREQRGQSPTSPRVESWVWVMDCTGMGWAACNPKIAMKVNSLLGDHYPERLGITVALNAGFLMRSAWAAIKVFLAPATAAKLVYLTGLSETEEIFDAEMYEWLLEEERLNKVDPLPESQKNFWCRPQDSAAHDPRGTRSYVREFVDGASVHAGEETDGPHVASYERPPLPHPNTVMDKRRASTAV